MSSKFIFFTIFVCLWSSLALSEGHFPDYSEMVQDEIGMQSYAQKEIDKELGPHHAIILNQMFKIKVFGPERGCFGGYFSEIGLGQAIRKQAQQLAFFLKDYAMVMKGVQDTLIPIKKVIFCDHTPAGNQLSYHNGELWVPMTRNFLTGNYRILTTPQIIGKWRFGTHLPREYPKLLWYVLNPLGTVRSALDRTLDKWRAGDIKLLNRIIERQESMMGVTLSEAQDLKEWIEGPDSKEFDEQLLLNAIVSTVQAMSIDLDQGAENGRSSLVNVGNYKRIYVGMVKSENPIDSIVEVKADELAFLKIKQRGLVNIYLVDDIIVSFPFHMILKRRYPFINYGKMIHNMN